MGTYLLLIDGEKLQAADVPAVVLWLHGRAGPLSGDDCRAERDELAAILGDGPLADLLRSGRPIEVDSGPGCYEFRG